MLERGKEQLAIKPGIPRSRCAHCVRSLKSHERLDVTIYRDGGLLTVTVCRACLQEHVPEALAEIEQNQPRRLR